MISRFGTLPLFSDNMLAQQQIMFIVLLNLATILGSKLPKYVDQQLNNQINEVLSDIIVPLQSISCFENSAINCFKMETPSRPWKSDWKVSEFQVSSHVMAISHKFKLQAFGTLPFETARLSDLLFETMATSPHPILMDLIIELRPADVALIQQSRYIYFRLVCVDCLRENVDGKSHDAIAFIILKQEVQNRSRRSITETNICENKGILERCCLQIVIVPKSIIFPNSSSIVAPDTIPVSYCKGGCDTWMYSGNHNFALLQYLHFLRRQKSESRVVLPCCSAREFTKFSILYMTTGGKPEMVETGDLVVGKCKCQ